jgi:hypothetical protein
MLQLIVPSLIFPAVAAMLGCRWALLADKLWHILATQGAIRNHLTTAIFFRCRCQLDGNWISLIVNGEPMCLPLRSGHRKAGMTSAHWR